MTLLDYAIVLFPLILVGAQVVMTRRYGWRGLACGSGAAIMVIFGGGAIVQAWKLDEFGFFWFHLLYAFFIVLIAAILLAFTVRAE